MSDKKEVVSGINQGVSLSLLTQVEAEIARHLSKSFYITAGVKVFPAGNSTYHYLFLKFTDDKSKAFGVLNEIIVLLSPFDNFEPRTLDAIEQIQNYHKGYRLDKVCAFVISKDSQFLEKLDRTIKSNKESRVITPFTYEELSNPQGDEFFRNRIKKYFFERNLFDLDSPLRKDLYFFGRDGIGHLLVDKHLSQENSGLFGLRRSGKTSILFSVSRLLESKNGLSVIIDCQLLHAGRWWDAIYYIIEKLDETAHSHLSLERDKYNQENAVYQFDQDIQRIRRKTQKKVLIILDEIEQITFGISFSDHWKSGSDYVNFWHTLRGLFQKVDAPFTFLIAGTNPRCIETPFVNSGDNPLYGQIKPVYIEGFDVAQTRQMIGTLSGYMGIEFKEDVYTYLTREFGGHPFLMRQACSFLKNKIPDGSVRVIDRAFYYEKIKQFIEGPGHTYCEMVVGVLREHYADEYIMLMCLARGELDDFKGLAESDPNYTQHLLGYGVIERTMSGYDFNMDILKKHLVRQEKYKRLNLTNAEKLAEISERRNAVEQKLRKLVAQVLLSAVGEAAAKSQMLAKHDNRKKARFLSLTYKELFDPAKHEIYFDDLRELMRKNWEPSFRNIFNEDVEKFNSRMILLNSIGRSDAHAKEVAEHDMLSFRGAMSWLEEKVEGFLK